ncbi:MAG: hypothetical protein DWI02_01815 [Planctomycetota bacterium]|nr:MAG: hypothetical protein DWI02_01815 [Planctomycetota bacterium]
MFLRRGSRVSVARGRDGCWGFLDRRSLDASRLGRGLGRLAPPTTGFFQMTGFSKKWFSLLVNLFNRQELADGK